MSEQAAPPTDTLVETRQPKLLIRNSKLSKLDLKKVTRIYANAATHVLAAKVIGVSKSYWAAVRNGAVCIRGVDYSDLLDAIEKGQGQCGMEVNGYLLNQAKTQALPAMFLAQQEHLGGMRNVSHQEVKHSGKLVVEFRETTGLPDPILVNPEPEVIDE